MDIGFILVTGLLTSFHCVAMCGTMVATYAIKDSGAGGEAKAKGGFDAAPHLVYHTAKLLSYTAVGFALGALGSALNLGGIRGMASLLAGSFMVLLGLNMLNVHPIFRIFSIRMPKFLQRAMFKDRGEQANRFATPAMFGLMTGFMPCGPLQAMQLYAAGTGSPFKGAAVMLLFGIMTVPTMLAFGAATQMLGHTFKKRIMTVGAVVVMGLGVVMLDRGLVLAGSPLTIKTVKTTVAAGLGFAPATTGSGAATEVGGVQQATIVISNVRYAPDVMALKTGVPVKLTIDRRESNACSDAFVIPALGVNVNLKPNAKTVVEFTPKSTGNVPFTCGMGMMSGTFIVTADGQAVASAGGGNGQGGAAGAQAGGPSQGTITANRMFALLLMATGLAFANRKYQSWQIAQRRAKREAEKRASSSGAGGQGARGAKGGSRNGASEPEIVWWRREPVWIAGALLAAVVSGYVFGTIRANSGAYPAGIANGQPAAQSPFTPAPQGARAPEGQAKLSADGKSQTFTLKVAGGYQPQVFKIKAGVPMKLSIDRHENSYCTKYLVFPDFDVNLELPDDDTLNVDVPGLKAGRYRFQCGMNMLSGEMVVE